MNSCSLAYFHWQFSKRKTRLLALVSSHFSVERQADKGLYKLRKKSIICAANSAPPGTLIQSK
jgi:hypothetical protein